MFSGWTPRIRSLEPEKKKETPMVQLAYELDTIQSLHEPLWHSVVDGIEHLVSDNDKEGNKKNEQDIYTELNENMNREILYGASLIVFTSDENERSSFP